MKEGADLVAMREQARACPERIGRARQASKLTESHGETLAPLLLPFHAPI